MRFLAGSSPKLHDQANEALDNPHNGSNLQTIRREQVRFWPKNRAILQKNRGPTEIILHFFSRFSGFLGFFLSQALD
jgi:hypothetical protein